MKGLVFTFCFFVALAIYAEDIRLDDKLIDCFDITPQNMVEIATKDQFYLLGSDTLIAHGKKSSKEIKSFTYLPDSTLLIVRDGEICSFDAGGNIVRLISLPFSKMGISSGKHVFYVYDQALYMFARGGKYQKLFEIPAFINDLVEKDNSILFATDDGIFEYSFLTRNITSLVKSPPGKAIISLAYDAAGRLIYYSTDQAVYNINNGINMVVTDRVGGLLKYDDGLFVFSPSEKLFLRLTGLAATSNSKLAEIESLVKIKEKGFADNALILNLVEKKYSEDKIIFAIGELKGNYILTVDSMINLSEKGVTSKIIMAMKNAMKRK